jgi:glutathione peroxidase
MKFTFLKTLPFALLFSCSNKQPAVKMNHKFTDDNKTIYQFKNVQTLDGQTFNFDSYKGKKIIIVNTASKCGLTPQYEDLQKLYTLYKEKNLEIIGFPSNNFLSQEPGTHSEIAKFCKENYGVSFQMMAKVDVKGDETHPVYQFLTQKEKNDFSDNTVKWNFQKYLIGEEGKLENVISPKTNPFDSEIINWLEE